MTILFCMVSKHASITYVSILSGKKRIILHIWNYGQILDSFIPVSDWTCCSVESGSCTQGSSAHITSQWIPSVNCSPILVKDVSFYFVFYVITICWLDNILITQLRFYTFRALWIYLYINLKSSTQRHHILFELLI